VHALGPAPASRGGLPPRPAVTARRRRADDGAASAAAAARDEALAALDADALRALLRDALGELTGRAEARILDRVFERAAGGAGWRPAPPTPAAVRETEAFARDAVRAGVADPAAVEDHLRRASRAFLGGDVASARTMLGALLPPLATGEVDLGQREGPEDALSLDLGACVAQYLVATYGTTAPAERAEAVQAALDAVAGLGYLHAPLDALERAAREPLPDLDRFLADWRALLVARNSEGAASARLRDQDRWLRQIVERLDGPAGLGELARASGRPDDLEEWCDRLAEAGDWPAALRAYAEAARLLGDDPRSYPERAARARLLDGAALAAQELGRRGLPARLEQAWRAHPTPLRLRRWLGVARGKAALRRRAGQALAACPARAAGQRALLLLLRGEVAAAAALLAEAPGLGWSGDDHPGRLVFPLLRALLAGSDPAAALAARPARALDLDEAEWLAREPAGAELATPTTGELLARAELAGPLAGADRAAALAAMRTAAARRVAGVTGEKRRRHYRHAAELVAACAALDPSPEAARWVAELRAAYRRFPALQRALDRAARHAGVGRGGGLDDGGPPSA